MSMEVENKAMPLIGYIAPLLNHRDLSPCDVPRNQTDRCYATVSLNRNRLGNYSISKMTITDAKEEVVRLPYVPTLEKEIDP